MLLLVLILIAITRHRTESFAQSIYPRAEDSVDDSTGSESDVPSCIRGTSIGQFIINSPNRSSIVVVGSNTLIKWTYSNLVTNPPTKIDIKIQQDGTQYEWNRFIVKDLELGNTSRSYNWTVQPLNDGPYKIRILPSGKETFGVKQDEMPCFSDGEVVVRFR